MSPEEIRNTSLPYDSSNQLTTQDMCVSIWLMIREIAAQLSESNAKKISNRETHSPASKNKTIEVSKQILDMINASPNVFWTSRSVIENLRASGIDLPINNEVAMNTVTYVLSHLTDGKEICRTHQGSGRDPHRYKAKEEAK